ncbi:MAG: FHA domain-containing protein [Planctomycetes bacterium]|nr:FHA domain-containing protein [Planctomycetota bacterium]
MSSLEFLNGPQKGEYLELLGSRTVVGRQIGCDIQLDDGWASREHLCLHLSPEGGCTAEDLGSENGSWVNGERIRRRVLTGGEVLRIGGTELRYHRQMANDSTEDMVLDEKTLRLRLHVYERRVQDLERELRALRQENQLLNEALSRGARGAG